ncbi:MAG: hypothetical protein AB1424_06255 [Thermodesulfobacteriota bacterium]
MEGCLGQAAGRGYQWLGTGAEGLDRAVVAGLMLDAALQVAPRPHDPQAWGRMLKIRVQEALLTHLAGRITLDRFRALISTLNHCLPFYLPLISPLLRPGPERSGPQKAADRGPPFPSSFSRAVRGDPLAAALAGLRGILPRRPHSKLQEDKLLHFLVGTRGCWFRLRDFQEHFSLERKTAWEYLRKFRQAGLLTHNRGRAASVRYALVDRFLLVPGAAVRGHAAAALADLDPHLGPRVADWLIASGGEAFWEEEWRRFLPGAPFQEILARLTKPASLLEVVSAGPGGSRLLQLQPDWRRHPDATS